MSELFEAAKGAAKEAVSAVFCAVGGLQRASQDIKGKLNPRYRGSFQERFEDRVAGAFQRFCPVPGEPNLPPGAEPPFSGGQCSGVLYRMRIEYYRVDTSDGSDSYGMREYVVRGPIRGWEIRGWSSAGSSLWLLHSDSDGNPDDTRVAQTADPNVIYEQVRIFQIERIDGLPDNCGDPPPELPPGTDPPTDPRPTLPDIDVDLPGIGPVSVPIIPVVGVVYADVDGSIKVPVTIQLNSPLLEVNPTFNFAVNLSDPAADPEPIDPPPVNDDDRPEPPDCPEPPECEEEPEEEEEPDEDEQAAKGREITGAVVLSVRNFPGAGRQTELWQGDELPPLFVPYLATVTFIYERPDGEFIFSGDIPVKRTMQVVPAPKTGLKVIAARCHWEQGWAGECFNISVAPPTSGCKGG